jgi:hypothetical protein
MGMRADKGAGAATMNEDAKSGGRETRTRQQAAELL